MTGSGIPSGGHTPDMRRIGVAISAVALAAALVAGASGTTLRSATATLRLVRTQPLTVRGLGFQAHERVRVTLTVHNDTSVRRAIAGPAGGFRVSFDDVPVTRCDAINVVAVGNRGSKAVLKRPPLPLCLPA
jgi:hypothetical protein